MLFVTLLKNHMYVLLVLKTSYTYLGQYLDFQTQNFVLNALVGTTRSQSFHTDTLHRVHPILLVSLKEKIFIEK